MWRLSLLRSWRVAIKRGAVLEEQEEKPAWLVAMGPDDLQFVKRFLLASGSLKDLARQYEVSYPTIRSRLDRLIAKDRPPTRDHLLNDLLATMACRAAVKAGDRLTAEEISGLLAQRALADDTHHCPHGRPTALLFSRHDLERQFRRV